MGTRFLDSPSTPFTAANMNAMDRGLNCYQSAAGGLLVDISAGTVIRPGSAAYIAYAGATSQAVTASQTNYVYLDGTGTLVINTTGFPADERVTVSGGSGPISGFVPLATVVTSSNGITSITDYRPAAYLPGQVTLGDPGSGQAIPVAGYMDASLPIVVASGVETNTIAAAQAMGQRILIGCKTLTGTSREVTFAAKFDGTNTKFKVTAVGQNGLFVAGADLNWCLVKNVPNTANSSATLS